MLLTIEVIREKIKAEGIRPLARKLNLHWNTLWKVSNGKADPSYKVLVKLSEYFNGQS